MRAEITDSFLERRPFKHGGRLHICDSRLIGFGCVIGGRTKTLILRQHGRELARWRWPVTPAYDARRQALELLRRVHAGEAIYEARPVKASALPTLRAVLEKYVETKADGLRPRTVQGYRDTLRLHAGDWLERPISHISPDIFLERFQQVKSPARAAYLRAVIRAVVRFAAAFHNADLADPTAKAAVVAGTRVPQPRTRRIPDERQRAFYMVATAVLDEEERTLLLLLALTGLRLEEGRGLQWEEIDTDAARITLPPARTKNSREHALPLGPKLVGLLRSRWEAQGRPSSGPVFSVPLHRFRRAYRRVSIAAGRFSPHDLRRGFATMAQRVTHDEALTKWLLNHAPQGVTQAHYLTRDDVRMRDAMHEIEASFFQL